MALALLSSFMLFLFLSLTLFTIPGLLLLNGTKSFLGLTERLTLSTIIGIIVFTLVYYILLLIHREYLIIPLAIIFDVIYLISCHKPKIKLKVSIKQLAILAIVFLLGLLGQLAITFPSGLNSHGSILFWSSHGHDGAWHIALMNEINSGWPFQNPSFAGEKLINYHFFSDIAPAFMAKFFHLSPLDLYFRFFPFLYSILLGASAFLLGKRLGKKFITGIWSTIFVYFAGSFGYIVTLIQGRGIGGESLFWATQIQSSIGNPPQILSNILLITFLFCLHLYLENKNKTIFIVCTLLAGSMAVFKVYAAVVVLAGLGVIACYQIIKDKKIDLLMMFFLSLSLSLILYLPNTSASASFLIFQPWWYIRTMVVESSRLNWIDLELRRQHYLSKETWHSYLRVIQIELSAFLIFFFGNLGMRFIGLLDFANMTINIFKSYFNLIFIAITLLSLALPITFLQKGVASNTSQFLQYFILLFGFLGALTISKLFTKIKPKLAKILISLVVIILAIPTQIGLLREFYGRSAFAKISSFELDALTFIKTNSNKDSVILTPPYNQYQTVNKNIPEIWLWFDTSYVSAISDRRVFVADLEQLDIMGYKFKDRENMQKEVFLEGNSQVLKNIITQYKVNIIYFPKEEKPKIDLKQLGLKQIYANNEVEVWKVN